VGRIQIWVGRYRGDFFSELAEAKKKCSSPVLKFDARLFVLRQSGFVDLKVYAKYLACGRFFREIKAIVMRK